MEKYKPAIDIRCSRPSLGSLLTCEVHVRHRNPDKHVFVRSVQIPPQFQLPAPNCTTPNAISLPKLPAKEPRASTRRNREAIRLTARTNTTVESEASKCSSSLRLHFSVFLPDQGQASDSRCSAMWLINLLVTYIAPVFLITSPLTSYADQVSSLKANNNERVVDSWGDSS